MRSTSPLSLYIHFPWCIRKCPYCDFNSHQQRGELPELQYIQALIKDLDNDMHQYHLTGRKLHSIFLGGGTPSLFSPENMANLLTSIKKRFAVEDIEITMEANPGSKIAKHAVSFRQAGINRLSLGVQSFNNHQLKQLGRIHDAEAACEAILAVKKADFANFNLDIMYALPKQQPNEAMDDLKQAMQYQPPHLSWYQLTLEPNTFFYKHPPTLPDDDQVADIEQIGRKLLTEAGYAQYEISAYCHSLHQCHHNLNYWQFGDYLGIGPGSHSKFNIPGESKIIRRWKVSNPKRYMMESSFLADEKKIEGKEVVAEFMLNALRLKAAIPNSLFYDRTGFTFEDIAIPLKRAEALGLLHCDNHKIQKTPLGEQFVNEILLLFESD